MSWMDAKTDDLLARKDGKIVKDPMALLTPILLLLALALALIIGILVMSVASNDDQLTSEHVCNSSPPDTTTHKDRMEIYHPRKIATHMHTPETAWTSSEPLLHTIHLISADPRVCGKSPQGDGENGDLHMSSFRWCGWGFCASGARGVDLDRDGAVRIPRGGEENGLELHTGTVG